MRKIRSSYRLLLLAAALGLGACKTVQTTEPGTVGVDRKQTMMLASSTVNREAGKAYLQALSESGKKNQLNRDPAQVSRVRAIAQRLIPVTSTFRKDAPGWSWEVNVISSPEINAWCMPGGKIAFYTGILEQLRLTDDEAAMIMGHEMAHALREHARARIAKSQGTSTLLSLGSQLLGLGQLGDVAASIGTQLLTLRFSRDDEKDADLVGLEVAARAGYNPQASVSLWEKMAQAGGGAGGPSFLSTHPSGPERIQQLQANVPKVQGLYLRARGQG